MSRNQKWIVVVFFLVYLLIGLLVVDDYGMSWDEATQRRNGLISLDHIIKTIGLDWELSLPDVNLNTSGGRQYTVLFTITAAFLERILGLEDSFRARYIMRHVMVFLLFWTACVYLFRLLFLRFRKISTALLGTCLLIFCPRIFAHSFYNPKDIILLSFYVISVFYLIRFFEWPRLGLALAFAFSTALVVNSRILGCIIPAYAIGLFFLLLMTSLWRESHQVQLPKRSALLRFFPVYLIVAIFLSILFFPFAWAKPIQNITEAFTLMANFPGISQSLYLGGFIQTQHTPWHYPYVWMGISIPIPFLVLFGFGLFLFFNNVWSTIRQPSLIHSFEQIIDWTAFALFVGPLLAVFLFKSHIYNGWRQLYFIYPMMVILASLGIHQLLSGTYKNYFFIILLGMILSVGSWMIQNHPYQQVYFNAFAGKQRVDRFDLDYWGLAYKQAMEELYQRDTSDIIQVKCANYVCEENYRFLPDKIKERVHLRYQPQYGEYYLSNFRRPKQYNKYKTGQYPYAFPYFFIEVDETPIIGVYRMN